ncbi:MAG: metal-dependent hydrolase [Pseudomonadota bacterium]
MDNLTHSLAGAALAQTGLKKKTGLGLPALVIGANLPDVDAACFFWLEGTEHLGFRRGITHGPPAWVLLPVVLAALLWWFDRWQDKRGKRPEGRLPVSFKWLYILSFIGTLSHPAMDWFNVYGIRLLEPFSSRWFYGNVLFIIDAWLIAILGIGVSWSARQEKRGHAWKRPAWITLAMATVYIGANWMITQAYEVRDSDVAVPGRVVIASPPPLFSWQREMITGQNGRYTIVDAGSDHDGDEHGPDGHTHGPQAIQRVGECQLEPAFAAREGNSQLDAFLFWSRTPFAQRAEDGSIVLYDARFFDPRARGRFSIALPDVECVELGAP